MTVKINFQLPSFGTEFIQTINAVRQRDSSMSQEAKYEEILNDIEIDGIVKRGNVIEPFQPEKMIKAARKAYWDANGSYPVNGFNKSIAQQLAWDLIKGNSFNLSKDEDGKVYLSIGQAHKLVQKALKNAGYEDVSETYRKYKEQREQTRNAISIRTKQMKNKSDLTDSSMLLVNSIEEEESEPWDRSHIVNQLLKETNLEPETANNIAKHVENQVIKSDFKTVDTTLLRELVNNVLRDRGYDQELKDLSLYRVSKHFVNELMCDKSVENSNLPSNNPEAVSMGLSEYILKQWALDEIYSEEVKKAHESGQMHVHDLGFPHRVYCSSHSLEYLKKYGLCDLENLKTRSKPAKSASVLVGHLNTFLASMQAYYAGALGLTYINILFAPYLRGKDYKEYIQIAQELIFNAAQCAFARGSQILFSDFNIHSGIPKYLQDVPAIGPGGRYMVKTPMLSIDNEVYEVHRDEYDGSGYPLMDLIYDGYVVLREQVDKKGNIYYDEEIWKENERRGIEVVTYKEYERESTNFARALLEVWKQGDKDGQVFEFPKCDFHVTKETFRNKDEYSLFQKACDVASHNGSTYFIFDRDEVTLSACCRLRTTVDNDRMLKHPENMRFCGFQNVTVNLPQAAYRAYHDGEGTYYDLINEVDKTMDLAVQAHFDKKRKIEELMSAPGRPLWQIGKPSLDGKPYVNLDESTYIIGILGLNDAFKYLFGSELHEMDDAHFRLALRLIAHMYKKTKHLGEKYGLKFTIEESPAESATRRLAKTDLTFYPNDAENVVKGENDMEYYTNSSHLSPECDANIVERIRKQGQFHNMIESGAITNVFVGEEKPSSVSIEKLVKDTLFKTQTAQITVSPELCHCNNCGFNDRGIKEMCERCGSDDLTIRTRIVGYFSDISSWSKSKLAELKDRQKGNYSLDQEDDQMVTV